MSSSQAYDTLPGTIDPQQMVDSGIPVGSVSNDWYATTSYSYQDPYMTPYPSSTVESQQWNQYARASVPDISFGLQPPPHQHQPLPSQFRELSRPKSSPSTFGPSPDSIPWSSGSNALGIQYTSGSGQPTPSTTAFPPSVFQTYPMDEHYSTSSPPALMQPQPRRPYTNIAPNPQGMAAVKRVREEDQQMSSDQQSVHEATPGPSSKRRKRTSSIASADLSEDDRFLVQLKEDDNLPWKDIATRFQTDKGKNFQVAALQMRYKRLREKFRVWEDQDVHALQMAHEYWEKYKWEIIGAKMLDFGISERWPARHCARRWQELESAAALAATTAGLTPGMSHFSSPVDSTGLVHFAFMPIQ